MTKELVFPLLKVLQATSPDSQLHLTQGKDQQGEHRSKNAIPSTFITGHKGMVQDTHTKTNRGRRPQQEVNLKQNNKKNVLGHRIRKKIKGTGPIKQGRGMYK